MNGTQMTVAAALEVLKSMPDLNICSDKEALRVLNKSRERLFMERSFTPTVTWCQPVYPLTVQCPPNCASCPVGFRLPYGFTGIPRAWQDRQKASFAPSWRDAPAGPGRCGPCVKLALYENNSPVEFDLNPCGCADRLWFEADKCDGGKRFRIVGMGQERYTLDYEIPKEGGRWLSEHKFTSIESVRLPALQKVLIIGQETGGRILSRYQPGETAPSYQTWILTEGSYCTIVVQAERGNVPLFDELDIVEFGETLVLEELARALKMDDKGDKSAADMVQIATHEARFKTYRGQIVEKHEKNIPIIMKPQSFSPRWGIQ